MEERFTAGTLQQTMNHAQVVVRSGPCLPSHRIYMRVVITYTVPRQPVNPGFS